jgi:hypothetical protein
MLLTKKTTLFIAEITAGIFIFFAVPKVNAYDINPNPQNLPQNLPQIPQISIPTTINANNLLPAPVSDFVNSLKQIGEGFASKVSNINFKTGTQNIIGDINNWFENTTGISLTYMVKVIGNLLVWVLSAVTNLIKWGLSFL